MRFQEAHSFWVVGRRVASSMSGFFFCRLAYTLVRANRDNDHRVPPSSSFSFDHARHKIKAIPIRLEIDVVPFRHRPFRLMLKNGPQQAVVRRDAQDADVDRRLEGRERHDLVADWIETGEEKNFRGKGRTCEASAQDTGS